MVIFGITILDPEQEVLKMARKSVQSMSIEELFEQFKSDILDDAHGLQIRYGRSDAQKALFKRADLPKVLIELIAHLREVFQSMEDTPLMMQLKVAWYLLIRDLCIELGMDTETAPYEIDALKWCDWAETRVCS